MASTTMGDIVSLRKIDTSLGKYIVTPNDRKKIADQIATLRKIAKADQEVDAVDAFADPMGEQQVARPNGKIPCGVC